MLKFFTAFAMAVLVSTTAYGQDKNIIETLKSSGDYSTFVELLESAGLTSTLTGSSKYTVFAPTNAAFNAMPADKLKALKDDPAELKKVLQYHIINSAIPANQLLRLKTARTLSGARVEFMMQGGKSSVQDAEIVKTDIQASNGVIHSVDAVLQTK